MSGLDLLPPWHDPAIASALGWYREVAANCKPAKFRIAATLPVDLELAGASEDELWAKLERLTPVFLERWQQIRDQDAPLGPGAAGPTLLAAKPAAKTTCWFEASEQRGIWLLRSRRRSSKFPTRKSPRGRAPTTPFAQPTELTGTETGWRNEGAARVVST
jgi:hypothetical protein